jgi:glycosyltransferase 2 family protein
VDFMSFELSKRHLLLCGVSLALLVAVAMSPQLLGDQVRAGFEGLSDANPTWLWIAAAGFVAALVAPAQAWRRALLSCGDSITCFDATARYGAGSLVNSLLPAKLGTAVRIALYSRAIHGEGRVWTAGGIATIVGVAYSVWLAVLVVVGAASGVLPLWPIFAFAGAFAVAAAVTFIARRWHPGARIGHLLDAFDVIGNCPKEALRLLGWLGLAMAAKIGAAAALLAAFGVPHPLSLAVLVVPAVSLAGTLPLTPGNLGISSAAVVFVLKTHGVAAGLALTTGIGYGAVETVASLGFGIASAMYLATPVPGVRRWTIGLAGAAGCAVVAGAFSFTVLVPLT